MCSYVLYVCTLEIADLASVGLASVYKIFCIYLYVGEFYATSGAEPQLKNLFVGQLQLYNAFFYNVGEAECIFHVNFLKNHLCRTDGL